jgi:hypothetical protein
MKRKYRFFGANVSPDCSFCQYGEVSNGQVLCRIKGITEPGYSCGKFTYSPLKRIPKRAVMPDFSYFTKEDFKI